MAEPEGEGKPKRRERLRERVRRHPVRSSLELIAIVGALVGLLLYWLHARRFEATDDAQIDGHLSPIGARIEGTIAAVLVDDNQWVAEGDPLVEIDPRDYQVVVARAEAQLLQSEALLAATDPSVPIIATESETRVANAADDVADLRAAVAAAERNAATAAAQLREAQAEDERAQAEVARYDYLLREQAVTAERRDEHAAAGKAARATVEARGAALRAARSVVAQQRARLAQSLSRKSESERNAPREVSIRDAQLEAARHATVAARATLDQARLALGYTHVVSPVAGIVARRNAEVGARVLPGQVLLDVVDVAHLYVTANFKETQLAKMRPGQRVRIHADAYDRDFTGAVESLPGATGARLSLLPPENATGNYVKVVQRLPVRIRIDPGQIGADLLRPGMSVEPRVSLR